MNLGMEGLMIESHLQPSLALSDAEQQVTPDNLHQLLNHLEIPVTHHVSHSDREDLEGLRLQIDSVDEQLMQMLHKRMDLARSIGALKQKNKWSLLSVARWREIIRSRTEWAQHHGLNTEFLGKVLGSVHEESIRVQGDEADRQRAEKPKKD
jgi:chorismate mutase